MQRCGCTARAETKINALPSPHRHVICSCQLFSLHFVHQAWTFESFVGSFMRSNHVDDWGKRYTTGISGGSLSRRGQLSSRNYWFPSPARSRAVSVQVLLRLLWPCLKGRSRSLQTETLSPPSWQPVHWRQQATVFSSQPAWFHTSWSSDMTIGLFYISCITPTAHNVHNMSHRPDYFLHSNCLGATRTYFFSPPSSYTASLPFIRPINIIGRAIITDPKSDPHGSRMWRSRKVAALLQMSPCQRAVTEDQCVRLPPLHPPTVCLPFNGDLTLWTNALAFDQEHKPLHRHFCQSSP